MILETQHWIVWMIVLPLLSAIFSFLIPARGKYFGLFTALFLPLSLVFLISGLLRDGVQRVSVGGWGASLGIDLYADGLALFLLLLTTLVGSVISFYAAFYFPARKGKGQHKIIHTDKEVYFWPLWNFLWAALNALYLSGDIFNLYVTLELAGLAAVALIALEGGTITFTAAMRYLLVSLLGSLFYLLGVALLYSQYATVDIAALGRSITGENELAQVSLVLMTLGLLLKIGVFPFHFWLPPAHANAMAPVSAILSALVVKAPLYLLVRLWFFVFFSLPTPWAQHFLGILGGVAVLWGSLRAMQQARLKLLVAYSTVAQLGYLFLIFPLVGLNLADLKAWDGAFIYAFSHACAKSAMFLSAGTIQLAAGNDFIAEIEQIHKQVPLSIFAFAIAGVTLIGLPPTGGFVGKWFLITKAIESGQWGYVLLLIGGSLITAVYVFRVLWRPFARVETTAPPSRPVSYVLEWSALLLAIGALVSGLIPYQLTTILHLGVPLTPG